MYRRVEVIPRTIENANETIITVCVDAKKKEEIWQCCVRWLIAEKEAVVNVRRLR